MAKGRQLADSEGSGEFRDLRLWSGPEKTPGPLERSGDVMSVRRRSWTDKNDMPQISWTVDIQARRPDGKAIRVTRVPTVNTRQAAEKLERSILEQIEAGTWGAEAPKEVPTFAEYEAAFMGWSKVNNKNSTVKHKEWAFKRLGPVFGQLRLDEISTAKIEAFKAATLWDEKKNPKGLKTKSLNNVLTVLAKVLTLATDLGVLNSKLPQVQHLRLPVHTFQFLEIEETARFLDAVADNFKAMATIGVLTGLRRGELLGLKWEDIDLKAGRLIVRRNLSIWGDEGSPKNGKTREVPLSPVAVETLKAHRSKGTVVPMNGPTYVFTDKDGQRLSHNRTRKVIERACLKAGLAKSLTWHDLRHTFASHLVMRGVPLRAVQELLGHATISMTERYAHLSPNVSKAAVLLLDEALNASPRAAQVQHGP